MKRIAVTGGRDYNDFDAVARALDKVHERYGEFILVSGNAAGADMLAEMWAKLNHIPVQSFPADWNKLGRAAGMIRNQQMVDVGLDGCVAFPGGKGTADMKKKCRAAGVAVWEPMV